MRLFLASLAIFAVAACSKPADETAAPADPAASADDSADANADESPAKTVEEMRAESLAAIDREACEARGGEVRQEGMLGMYRCVTPYADAGKECRDDADCEGKCLATDDAMVGEETTGACQANDSPFGCYAEIKDGKITDAICVD